MLSSACTSSAEAVVVPGLCWEPGLEPAPGDGQNVAPGMESKGKAMPCSQRGPACKQGSISLSGPLLSSLKCYLLTGSLISYNEARIVALDFGLSKWKQILTPLQKDNDIPFFLPASFAAPSACSFSLWKLLLDMVAPDASSQPSASMKFNTWQCTAHCEGCPALSAIIRLPGDLPMLLGMIGAMGGVWLWGMRTENLNRKDVYLPFPMRGCAQVEISASWLCLCL